MIKKKEKVRLTDDSLTNIRIMIPMLDDEARKAVSYLMYGCYLGEEIAKEKSNKVKIVEKKRDETSNSDRIFKRKSDENV